MLLEHFAGNFPTWLAPVQVRVLPVATAHEEYAEKVVDRVRAVGGRVDLVGAGEQLGKRIRAAKLEKLPVHPGRRRRRRGRWYGRRQPRGGASGPSAASTSPSSSSASPRRSHVAEATPELLRALMLERLWNGWRNAYVSSGGAVGGVAGDDVEQGGAACSPASSPPGCPTTRPTSSIAATTSSPSSTHSPTQPGHLLVVPYREVADLEALEPAEAAELWATVTDAVVAVKRAYAPEGINVGVNLGKPAGGSISDHVHVHVVPRWTGDSNFMTALANTRTIPEALPDSRRQAAHGVANAFLTRGFRAPEVFESPLRDATPRVPSKPRVTTPAAAAAGRSRGPADRRRRPSRSPTVRIVQRSGRRSGSSSSSQRDGHRHRRAGRRAGAERRDERLVDGVLGVVEAGEAAALRPSSTPSSTSSGTVAPIGPRQRLDPLPRSRRTCSRRPTGHPDLDAALAGDLGRACTSRWSSAVR